jgi:hypothetical protein
MAKGRACKALAGGSIPSRASNLKPAVSSFLNFFFLSPPNSASRLNLIVVRRHYALGLATFAQLNRKHPK